jgi:hypothetical protein
MIFNDFLRLYQSGIVYERNSIGRNKSTRRKQFCIIKRNKYSNTYVYQAEVVIIFSFRRDHSVNNLMYNKELTFYT